MSRSRLGRCISSATAPKLGSGVAGRGRPATKVRISSSASKPGRLSVASAGGRHSSWRSSPTRFALVGLLGLQPMAVGCVASQERDPEELTDRVSEVLQHAEFDCNHNGIRDSIDIARGVGDDVNHNGRMDPCDPDKSVGAPYVSDAWRAWQTRRDTSFFFTTCGEPHTVIAHYTVPAGGGAVHLAIEDSSRRAIVVLVNTRKPPGAYALIWDRKDARGQTVAAGDLYTVSLRVGTRNYRRVIQWAD